MKDPYKILQTHEQKHLDSCVPWGLEFILKVEDKISPDEYPLQTKWPTGCGFGPDEKAALTSYGILAEDAGLKLDEFEKKAKDELAAGRIIIFTVPDHLNIDWANKKANWVFHTWAVAPKGSGHEYLSRAYNHPNPLPQLPLVQIYDGLRKGLMPNWLVHTLWYKKR